MKPTRRLPPSSLIPVPEPAKSTFRLFAGWCLGMILASIIVATLRWWGWAMQPSAGGGGGAMHRDQIFCDFYPASHRYTINERIVPSVTQVIADGSSPRAWGTLQFDRRKDDMKRHVKQRPIKTRPDKKTPSMIKWIGRDRYHGEYDYYVFGDTELVKSISAVGAIKEGEVLWDGPGTYTICSKQFHRLTTFRLKPGEGPVRKHLSLIVEDVLP